MRLAATAALIGFVALKGGAMAAERVVLPTNVTPSHYDIAIRTDAAHLTFAGSVKIDIDVRKPAKTIELNAANLVFGKVTLSNAPGAPKISYDSGRETATLTFPAEVAKGRHLLTIAYTGKINQQTAGLFALDYGTTKGSKRALFTQFENSDARRFVPCWDEPNRKAVFALSATVPADQMAIANTPVVSSTEVGGGLRRVVFAPSPKMSSYLLFFALGDFERVSRKVKGVDIGIVVKRGDADKAGYALDAASRILPYYEEYFGVKYPLPKLDLIAGPGSSQFFGAMENWGAIFYFERDVEIDAKLSTERDRRGVYVVIAHEMAHQWFGDLVTMDWWDDLWLNEGFASWMELKATDHFHPEWKIWLDALSAKEGAMRVDARAGTHPIVTPIRDVLQANQAFDTITYSKGMSVIRMLENYVGADVFRAGVRNYIKAHAYGNTVTDDLWRELDKVSPRPITKIAHDFTLQPGVPLIRVAPSRGGDRLTQDRFAMDATAKTPLTWHVPVLARQKRTMGVWRGVVVRNAPVEIAHGVGVVNEGQAGYFRTLYEPSLLREIVLNFRTLPADDQLGLINDTRLLGYAGYEPLADFLGIARQAGPAMNTQVQSALAERLEAIDALYDGLPGQSAFRDFGRRLLNPLFAPIGWDEKKGEDQNVAVLRSTLLEALSRFDDAAVIAEARKRFAAYRTNPSAIAADARHSMLVIVARHADAVTWEQIHALARAEKSTMAKQDFYGLLGSVHDRALAGKALSLALTDEAAVTTRPNIVRNVGAQFPEMAFDFASAHLAKVYSWLETDSRNQYVPGIASNSNDEKMITRLKAFAAAHIPATADSAVVKAVSAIAFNSGVRARCLPEVDRWLAANRAG